MFELKVPYLPQAKIESAANELLRKYGKWKGIEIKPPIDIDEIIEGYFGLRLTFCNLEEILGMDDVLGAMADIVAEGKVRAFGLSNESAWGTCRWIDRAEATGGPRVASVQNEYSLLCRLYDTDMAEVGVNEDVTLLAFSPLGAGLLTGKYQNGALPEGSRMAINGDLGGRKSDRVFAAVDAYLGVARRHGLDPVHMAMAWQTTRPFPNCPIFGATTSAQLETILGGIGVTLSDEVLADIARVHKTHPMPY